MMTTLLKTFAHMLLFPGGSKILMCYVLSTIFVNIIVLSN